MIPYFAIKNVTHALAASSAITVVMLIGLGYLKSYYLLKNNKRALWGAAQTLAVGIVTAGSSYGIVYGINSHHHGYAG